MCKSVARKREEQCRQAQQLPEEWLPRHESSLSCKTVIVNSLEKVFSPALVASMFGDPPSPQLAFGGYGVSR
jgi:hypothetical protein